MGLALNTPLATAVQTLNDVGLVAYTEDELVSYGNDAIRTLTTLVPHLFYERGDVSCVTGEAAQSVSFSDALGLVSVDRVKGGDAVHQADKTILDRYSPGWMKATAAPAKNWLPHADSPVRFYVSPPAPANQVLEVTYVALPKTFVVDEDTGLPVTLSPAISDYMTGMAMSKDDEHINAGRAQAFLASFIARVKGA